MLPPLYAIIIAHFRGFVKGIFEIPLTFFVLFDLCVEVERVQYQDLCDTEKPETSKEIQTRVLKAREIQQERYQGLDISTNAQLGAKEMKKYCHLGKKEEQVMRNAFESMGMSARSYYKVLGVARTIADLDGDEEIRMHHLKEALGYRMIDKKYWGRTKI